ncbi:MAG: aldo/keto reductase [Planctomycetaceae bacterium]|jgi:aryl-alcohol dehydrogenase-like predicted oxidoreductase|nr:aldo/keto reductase [Planctomycetaceae bacterium]
MKRRDFLGMAALSAGTLALGSVSAQETAKKSNDPAAWVQLTKEVKCSRIGFGTGMRGSQRASDLTRMGWSKGIELLQFAYDHGVRFFDCADLYGTHFIVAEAMKGKARDSYVLGTKLWLLPGGIPEQERLSPEQTVPRFLRELKTDYIDLVQIHCMTDGNWSAKNEDAMASLARLKEKGVIRAHGVSTHSNAAVEHAAKTTWCDTIHVRINSEGMNMDGPKDDAAKRVEEGVRAIQSAHDAGKGIIAMKVLGEGKMSGNFELRKKSTNFVKNLDCVDVMIVGFTEKQHVTEFQNLVNS